MLEAVRRLLIRSQETYRVLPIRDDTPSRITPWAVFTILAMNALVLFLEQFPSVDVPTVVGTFGLVPHRFMHWTSLGGSVHDPWRYLPLFSAMFLHDGWLHFATNMLYLWTFGRALEARLGRSGLVITYALSGLAAGLGQLLALPGSNAAMVGASGAIAGLLGAYLVCFPRAKLTLAFPFYLVPWVLRVRAMWFLLAWVGLQVCKGTMDLLSSTADPPVAWWAHVAGFVAGMCAALAGRAFPNDSIQYATLPRLARAGTSPRASQLPNPPRTSRMPTWTDWRGSLLP